MSSILQDIKVINYGLDQEEHNYTRCKEIHRAFHTPESDFNKFIYILSEYKNEMMSKSDHELIKELVSVSLNLKQIYPTFKQCIELKLQDKVRLAQDFDNLIRNEILPLNYQIFQKQLNRMNELSQTKYKYDLVEYTQTSLERLEWIRGERSRVVKKLSDPNYFVSTEKLRTAQKSIEENFMKNLLPKYIRFLSDRNQSSLKNIKKTLTDNMHKKSDADKYVKLSNIRRNEGLFRTAIDQSRVIHRYCEYARYLLLTSDDFEQTCETEKTKIKSLYSEIFSILPTELLPLNIESIWVKNTEFYQTSRTIEYANRIKEWNDKRDKWCLKNSHSCGAN